MSEIGAQISLYPLRQSELSPVIDKALAIFARRGLSVRPGAMSSLVSGEDELVFAALSEAWREVAATGDVVMTVTISNACPLERATCVEAEGPAPAT